MKERGEEGGSNGEGEERGKTRREGRKGLSIRDALVHLVFTSL